MKVTKLLSFAIILCLVITLLTACVTENPYANNNNNAGIKNNVNNIFLSKDELHLSVGETFDLIATVSPANADVNLTWSSSNNSVVEVDTVGKVTAKDIGNAVVKVVAPNGVLAVCNVDVKQKVGSVTGNVTYKYNDYVGNKADTGTIVMLVSKTVESLDYSVAGGYINSLPKGCFGTKVDGSGNYRIDNVPVGEYYIIMISKNTNENPDKVMDYRSWGVVYMLFSKEDRETAMLTAKVYKTRTSSITVSDGQTTTFSYDFGVTYF